MPNAVLTLALFIFVLGTSPSVFAHKMPESEKRARLTEAIENNSGLRTSLGESYTLSLVTIKTAIAPNLMDFTHGISTRIEMDGDQDFDSVDFLVTTTSGRKFEGSCYIFTSESTTDRAYKYDLGALYHSGCGLRTTTQDSWWFFSLPQQEWMRPTRY